MGTIEYRPKALLVVMAVFMGAVVSHWLFTGEPAFAHLRSNYESSYKGQPLMGLERITCHSELAGSTGYYYNDVKGGVRLSFDADLVSSFKKQSNPATWEISITGNQADVQDGQGNRGRYQITKRGPDGLILVEVQSGTSIQVITIDPRNSSFVYTTQNVHFMWNRASTWVGQCS